MNKYGDVLYLMNILIDYFVKIVLNFNILRYIHIFIFFFILYIYILYIRIFWLNF